MNVLRQPNIRIIFFLLLAAASAFFLLKPQKTFTLFYSSEYKEHYERALSYLSESYPFGVSYSPDLSKLLLKTKGNGTFKLDVLSTKTREVLFQDTSRYSQLSLSWLPSSSGILFQESSDLPFLELWRWDFDLNKRMRLPLPPSKTAIAPISIRQDAKKFLYVSHLNDRNELFLSTFQDDSETSPVSFIPIAINVDLQCGGIWDKKENQFATIRHRTQPELLIIDGKTGKIKSTIPIPKMLRCKQIAWHPNSDEVLLNALFYDEEYHHLYAVKPEQKTIKTLSTGENSDITKIITSEDYLGIIAHKQNANSLKPFLVTEFSPLRDIFPQIPVENTLIIRSHKEHLGYLQRSQTSQPHFSLLPGSSEAQNSVRSQVVFTPSPIGTTTPKVLVEPTKNVPILHWAPDVTTNNTPILVYVHGGPHLHIEPSFNPVFHLFNRMGYELYAPNYRGSSGYGQRYQDEKSLTSHAEDIVNSVRYILSKTPNSKDRPLILFGSSYGASVALEATQDLKDRIHLLVLTKFLGISSERVKQLNVRTLAFLGKHDPLVSSEASLSQLKTFFNGQNRELLSATIFPEERHSFQSLKTWATISATMTKVLDDLQVNRADPR